MDKVIEEEKEFIQNFALELTNRTLNQREEIGKKYYKQLQRLEQENETLERTNNELRKRFSEDTTKLSAENKELSESVKRLKNMAKAAALGREKYKQALQEIRDIAEEISREKIHNPDIDTIIDKINSIIGAE